MPVTPIIREIEAKTVLNRSKLGGYSLNCYVGCAHACVYCYARFMQRFHPHEEPWGAFVDVKTNAVEALVRQLRRAQPGHVFMSSACDAYQPLERRYRLTRRCAETLMRYGFEVRVLTKSSAVLDDLEMYASYAGKGLASIGVTITTPDEYAARLWEPHASPVSERIEVLRKAGEAGLDTSVMFGPLLPGVSDDDESLDRLFEIASDLQVGGIWTDAMNPRPKVWESVRAFLDERYPGLKDLYRRVLFDKRAREQYVADLNTRIRAAAKRHGLGKQLGGC